MMNFKQYIEEEIKKESVLSPLKFLGGFGGNIIGQGIKGLGNSISGAEKIVSGSLGATSNLASSGIYRVLGNKKLAKEKLNRTKENIKNIGSGLGKIVKASIQLGGAATLITPTLRGFQAAAEKGISGFNKNRNYAQKLLGLNSNEETPFVIKNVPKDIIEAKTFIEEFYEQTKIGREIKIGLKPEKFLKRFMVIGIATLKKYKDSEIKQKFKFLLNTYFPDFEVVELNVGIFLSDLYNVSDAKEYINYLYDKSNLEKIVIITNSDKIFFKELEKIYKEVPFKIEEEEQKEDFKNKIKKIILKFMPNKYLNE